MFFRNFLPHPTPRGGRAAPAAWCLLLVLSLTLGQAGAGPTGPTAAALRDQVAAAGWLPVRVELRASTAADDLEQTAQDLLFALPAGSYHAVARTAGSASLALRVDAAGLDVLLGSPWAAAVAAGGNADM